MKSIATAGLGLLLALAAMPGVAVAQSGGLADFFANAPEAAPEAAPPPPAGATPQLFPALAGCEGSLAGLAFGHRDAVVAQLERRIGLWEGATFGTVPPFRSLPQARVALDCFTRRLNLLTAFIEVDDEVLRAAADFQTQWGDRAASLLSGEVPPAADPASWWAEADQALGLLSRVEREIGGATANAARVRGSTLSAARAALSEFERMVQDIGRLPAPAAGEAFQWGRGLAWRALLVGVELDRMQLEDLRRRSESAYALLTGTTPTATVSPELVQLLGRTAALRQARGNLVPGSPRDWSQEGDRSRLAEELYMLHAIEQNLTRWIGDALRDRADRKRLQLQLEHDAAVFGGMAEAQSRALRDAEWRAFLESQAQERTRSDERWRTFLAGQRDAVIAAAIALPP